MARISNRFPFPQTFFVIDRSSVLPVAAHLFDRDPVSMEFITFGAPVKITGGGEKVGLPDPVWYSRTVERPAYPHGASSATKSYNNENPSKVNKTEKDQRC